MNIYSAKSIDDVTSFLQSYGAESIILAGGTDVVVKYKNELLTKREVCDIYGIRDLRYIKETADHLAMGSLTTHKDLAESKLVNNYAPILAQAAASVGSPQIRNRGTIGGNIGTASPAGDTLPALMALGACIKVINSSRERTINIRDFFVGPGKTVLKPDEFIYEITIPKLVDGEKAFFSKLGSRSALAISIASVAAKVKLGRGVFTRVEISLGSLAPTVIYKRLSILEGERLPNKELWNKLQHIKKLVSPINDVRASAEYKNQMAVALLFQGLKDI
ncbi:MAG: xanthine dehydrogenase family protein subunit M [Firmicutes bacterium]|nr:xanthine dehydrogenase family protein subunit M [Bacillota bacterium]